MNSAYGRAGNINFVEFLQEPAAVAGREFYSGEEQRGNCEIGLANFHVRGFWIVARYRAASAQLLAKDDQLREQRDVTGTRFGAAVDGKAFRPREGAIDEWGVQLKSEAAVEAVAGHELCDGTVEVLAGGVLNFASIELECAEVRELFRDRAI